MDEICGMGVCLSSHPRVALLCRLVCRRARPCHTASLLYGSEMLRSLGILPPTFPICFAWVVLLCGDNQARCALMSGTPLILPDGHAVALILLMAGLRFAICHKGMTWDKYTFSFRQVSKRASQFCYAQRSRGAVAFHCHCTISSCGWGQYSYAEWVTLPLYPWKMDI